MKTKLIVLLLLYVLTVSLNARYYNPTIGRFITADSVIPGGGADLQGLNRYSYCLNNPIKYLDPTGHKPLSSFLTGLLHQDSAPWLDEEGVPEYSAHVGFNTRLSILSGLALSSISHLGFKNSYKVWSIQNDVYKKYPSYLKNEFIFKRHIMFGFLTSKKLGDDKAGLLHKLIPYYQYNYSKMDKNLIGNSDYDSAGKLYYDIGRYLYNHFKKSDYNDVINLAVTLKLFFNTANLKQINSTVGCSGDECKDLITFNYFDKKSGNLLSGNLITKDFGFGVNGISLDNINKFVNFAGKMGWDAKYSNEIVNKYKDVIVSGNYSTGVDKKTSPDKIFKK